MDYGDTTPRAGGYTPRREAFIGLQPESGATPFWVLATIAVILFGALVLAVQPKLGAPVLSLGKANQRRLRNPRQGRPSQ